MRPRIEYRVSRIDKIFRLISLNGSAYFWVPAIDIEQMKSSEVSLNRTKGMAICDRWWCVRCTDTTGCHALTQGYQNEQFEFDSSTPSARIFFFLILAFCPSSKERNTQLNFVGWSMHKMWQKRRARRIRSRNKGKICIHLMPYFFSSFGYSHFFV